MSASVDLELMRASMLLETDAAAAARAAGAVLLIYPGHDAASLLMSAACRRLGNPSSAVGIMEALAGVQPASAVVYLELGRTYAACASSLPLMVSRPSRTETATVFPSLIFPASSMVATASVIMTSVMPRARNTIGPVIAATKAPHTPATARPAIGSEEKRKAKMPAA